jgi:hypothetical protein
MAMAINFQCNLCNTFAAAYQFTIQADGPVHFTSDGRQELAAIRKEIRELEQANLSPFELAERLKPLIERLKTVLATQLVKGPPVFDENDGQDQSNAGETVPNGGSRTVSTLPEATVTGPGDTATTETTPTTTEGTTTGVTTTTP